MKKKLVKILTVSLLVGCFGTANVYAHDESSDRTTIREWVKEARESWMWDWDEYLHWNITVETEDGEKKSLSDLVGNVDTLKEKVEIRKEATISGVENISIDSEVGDINLEYTDGEKLEVVLTHNIEEDYAPELTLDKSSDEIRIISDANFKGLFGFPRKAKINLTVKIPRGYDKDFKIINVSGDITSDEDLKGRDIEVKLEAGNQLYEGMNFDRAVLECNAGNIEILKGYIAESKIELNAGNIFIKGAFGNIDTECNAGNLDIHLTDINGNIDARMKNGSMEVVIPDDSNAAFNIRARKYSRSITSEIDIIKESSSLVQGKTGDGHWQVDLECVNGYLKVKN